jgi:hypothetical protein
VRRDLADQFLDVVEVQAGWGRRDARGLIGCWWVVAEIVIAVAVFAVGALIIGPSAQHAVASGMPRGPHQAAGR